MYYYSLQIKMGFKTKKNWEVKKTVTFFFALPLHSNDRHKA
jgi:hypothetical protein